MNRIILVIILGILSKDAVAQDQTMSDKHKQRFNYVGRKGQWYFSWGYNEEWYTQSNIHVNQPALGNNYDFRNVIAEDKPGWNNSILHQPISIPQYNYRLGHWFKDNWGIEINFDHAKYQVLPDQLLHIKGTMNGRPIDTLMINNGTLVYQLNNGANFFLFNLVHRLQVPYMDFKYFNLSLLLKGGVGFMYPHVQNTIFGHDNVPDFQFGGLDFGGEAAVRATLFKYVYLEYCNKLIFTNYWGLKIYDGKVRQNFGTYEMILNLGVNIPLSHPNGRY